MRLTYIYRENLKAWLGNNRIIANKGGTRSGKTYSLVSLFVTIATGNTKRRVIDIVSESLPHLKRGAINDIEDILTAENLVEGVDYEKNETDHIYSFRTGTKIRFFSADDWGKVKGSRRDILFINECNRIDYEIFRQLAVRTVECVFIDWNPDTEFWYEIKGIQGRENTVEIHSTYKDNPYLSKQQVAEIESNKDDENWWKVYGLGETGRPIGVIYSRWRQVDSMPIGAKRVWGGLDFGFTNDPTALVEVALSDGKLWIDEKCYDKGLTNDMIAERIKESDLSERDIVADSAEQKSIREIYNYGIKRIEGAEKGSDSIRNGIQILRRYEICVTKRSLNVIREFRNYKYKENKITGELTNEPIDKFNHAMDAVRYVALNKLSERPVIKKARAKLATI